MNLYLSKNHQQLGPYSIDQIQIFLKQGLVTTEDFVWANEWSSWMTISKVPGLDPSPSPNEAREHFVATDQHPKQQSAPYQAPIVSETTSNPSIQLSKHNGVSKSPSKLDYLFCAIYVIIGIGICWLLSNVLPPAYVNGIAAFFRSISHFRI